VRRRGSRPEKIGRERPRFNTPPSFPFTGLGAGGFRARGGGAVFAALGWLRPWRGGSMAQKRRPVAGYLRQAFAGGRRPGPSAGSHAVGVLPGRRGGSAVGGRTGRWPFEAALRTILDRFARSARLRPNQTRFPQLNGSVGRGTRSIVLNCTWCFRSSTAERLAGLP